MNINSMPML